MKNRLNIFQFKLVFACLEKWDGVNTQESDRGTFYHLKGMGFSVNQNQET